MSELRLFGSKRLDSPWVMSAFVALEEKKLSYEVVNLDTKAGEHKTQGVTGRIPTLVHDGFSLAESSAIAEYLADVFPYPKHPRLFPEELKQRALCRMIQGWLRSDFSAIRAERSSCTVFCGEKVTAPLSAAAHAELERLLRGIEPLLHSDTLFGSWCIADADLAMMLQRLNLNGEPLPSKVKAYAEKNWQRPSVQKWLALERPRASLTH